MYNLNSKLSRDHSRDNPADFEESFQDTEIAPLVALSDLLADLYSAMFAKGYEMIPSVAGLFCTHDVYVSSAYPVMGIDAPESFRFKKLLNPEDESDVYGFRKALRQVVDKERQNADHKTVASKWATIYQDFSDSLRDPRCSTSKAALGVAKSAYRTTTLTGRNGAHKCIPPVSWFPESIRSVEPRALLTLLPDVEAKALMLHLGRIAVGASNTKILEGSLIHTYRSYCLLVGTQAGLGKSTLLNYLLRALTLAGYTTSQINSDLNKFGWGTIAVSDVATIDDLTDDLQKKLITDPRIKSVTSNGTMKVEEKGLAAVDIYATTAILGCTNMTNYAHFIGMDSGCVSRLNQLDTFTLEELKDHWGTDRDYRTKPFWEQTAEDCGVSTEVLALWLLRGCMDMFLETAGYAVDNGILTRVSEDRLEAVVKELREAYRIDVNLKHVKELVQVAIRLTALSIAKSDNPVIYRHYANHLDYDYHLLLTVMRWFCDDPKGCARFPELTLNDLSRSCQQPIRVKVADLKQLTNVKSASSAFEVLTKELVSTKGFGYPTKAATYASEWASARRDLDLMIRQYQDADISGLVWLEGAVDTIQRRLAKLK